MIPTVTDQRDRAVVIGDCHYCHQDLYSDGPTTLLDEPLSHVACAVDARRTGIRQ